MTVAADVFGPAAAGLLAARLVRVLAAVAADPGLRVRQVTVLGEAERRQLTEEWNDTGRAVPAGRCRSCWRPGRRSARTRSRWRPGTRC